MNQDLLVLDFKYFTDKFKLIVRELNDIYPERSEDLRVLYNIVANRDKVEGDIVYIRQLLGRLTGTFRLFSKYFIDLESKFDILEEEIKESE